MNKPLTKLLSLCLISGLLAACSPQPSGTTTPGTTAPGTTSPPVTTTAAQAPGGLKPGTYTTEAQGHNAPIKVEMTVDGEKILNIAITEHKETVGIAEPALDRIPKQIIEFQSLAVDSVAGATFTSKAILSAVEKGLTEAGAEISAFKIPKSDIPAGKTVAYETDVIVVGSGIAGLSAALEAADNGARVILLEKMASVGGSSVRSGGKLLAAGSSIQKAAGIEDTPEQFANYLMEVGEHQVDKSFIDLIANNSAGNIEWLLNNGVGLSDQIEPLHSTMTPARGHFAKNGSGSGIILPLYDKVKEKQVEVLLETPALSLIFEDGMVTGVRATNLAKDDITITARSVVLATGGFSRNQEYVAKYYPSAGNFSTGVGDGSTGDGITMGLTVDAELIMPDGGINLTLNPMTYYGYGEEAKGLFVSPDGERFMDESLFHFRRTRIMMDLNMDNCWYIFDESTFNDGVAQSLAANLTVEADSLAELAAKMKADPSKLEAAVSDYNKMAKTGEDTQFKKPAEFMKPIETGKFYAAHLIMTNSGTHGGLKIDIDGHVINTTGQIIPGLFAAGEVASGQILYKEYPGSGTALISFLTFGRQAGKAAAKAQ